MTKLASLEDGHNVAPKSASNGSSPVGNFLFQVKLLLWKRYLESTKSKWDLLKVLLPAVLFFILMILLYAVFDFFAAGAIEPFLVPLAFWIYIQRIVVQIMFEKSSRLQESMRMMGLSDVAYYTSYFISDGVILGFLLSFLVTLFTVGGLFNGANFGVILGFLFVFCLSAIPFAFFVCAFFDPPQTSGQATLGILFGTPIILFTSTSRVYLILSAVYIFRLLHHLHRGVHGGHRHDFSQGSRDTLLLHSAHRSADWRWLLPQVSRRHHHL